jgi:hypothetical protein
MVLLEVVTDHKAADGEEGGEGEEMLGAAAGPCRCERKAHYGFEVPSVFDGADGLRFFSGLNIAVGISPNTLGSSAEREEEEVAHDGAHGRSCPAPAAGQGRPLSAGKQPRGAGRRGCGGQWSHDLAEHGGHGRGVRRHATSLGHAGGREERRKKQALFGSVPLQFSKVGDIHYNSPILKYTITIL